MCTVSVIPLPDRRGYRLVTNRDELKTRPPALRPRLHTPQQDLSAIWPVDPDAGGTWIATSNHQLTLCTMNINPDPRPAPPADDIRRSRGMVIPALINSNSATHAIERLESFNLDQFKCFRLIAVDHDRVLDAVWDQSELFITDRPLESVCFATSGIGDHRVQARVTLFDWWFAGRPGSPERQDAFHHHRWPERGEISVNMHRSEARTVSITSVEVPADDDTTMIYRDEQRNATTHRLETRAQPARHARV